MVSQAVICLVALLQRVGPLGRGRLGVCAYLSLNFLI